MSHAVSRRSMLVGALGVAGGAGLGTSATVGASRPRHTAPHPRVRVMTWNMHGAVPADGPDGADEERIAAVIGTESPDILILNEVNQDPAGPGSFGDQPATLEALLTPAGYRYLRYGIAERDLPRDGVVLPGSSTGTMIISRHPFVGGAELVKLPNENYEPGGKDRRSLLLSTVAVPDVGDVTIHATHLSTPGSAALVEDQKEQIQIILDQIDSDAPSILAGDLNIRVTDVPNQEYSQNNLMHSWIADANLADTWRQVNNSGDGPTFGDPENPHPDRRIDYVFASPQLVTDSGHISQVDPYASDHFPVVIDLLPVATRALRASTVLAGADALHGWAQLADTGSGTVRLSVCKNYGTSTDDGTQVRAGILSHSGRVVHSLSDGGTSRDRATVETWRGRVPPRSTLRTSLLQGETVLHTREELIS